MNTTYCDVVIEYREADNVWGATINGRERSFSSLSEAKRAVDAYEERKMKAEEKPFVPFEAFYLFGGKKVRVTSIAENRSRWNTSNEVWISSEGTRFKVSAKTLFEVSDQNILLLESLKKAEAVVKAAEEEERRIQNGLTTIESVLNNGGAR